MMIVDEQHAALHNAAQHVCMNVEPDLYRGLPVLVRATLARLAVVCGCTHLEWWSADACVTYDREPTPLHLRKQGPAPAGLCSECRRAWETGANDCRCSECGQCGMCHRLCACVEARRDS